MKFSKIFLLLIIAFSIISCKSDDDGSVAFNLSKANLAGTHDLTYFTASRVITGTVGGSPFTVSYNVTSDTYQVEAVFTEAGGYTINGEFRTTTTSSDGSPPQVEIITIDESGTYQVNDTAQTIVMTEQGGSVADSDVNTVTLFNETELRITFGETYTEDGDDYVTMQELRFVRQ